MKKAKLLRPSHIWSRGYILVTFMLRKSLYEDWQHYNCCKL